MLSEPKQRGCTSKKFPTQETWWLSLGFLPAWLYEFHRWYYRCSTSKRACTTGLSPYNIIRSTYSYEIKAPVHTDSMTVYERELRVIRTVDGHEIRKQERVAKAVVEQRISHFVMGLAIIGTMTGPLLTVLNLIPRALFGGVFFVVGVSSLPKQSLKNLC